MKRIFCVVICFISLWATGQTWQNKMYLPDGSSSPHDATYISGPIQDWYKNLEKYWYYRYRLVNDFMFIANNDMEGSSIPAQKRVQSVSFPWSGNTCQLSWADATIDLGHYIQMLATEEQNLNDFHYSVVRTQWEMQHALNAFDRLDDNAEEYETEVSGDVGPFHGYPGTIGPSPVRNGFFIRDDVPYGTIFKYGVDPVGNLKTHFNRPGLQRTWQYPGSAVMFDNHTFTYFMQPGNGYYDQVDNAKGDFMGRWEGTYLGFTESTISWPYSVGRYPVQESYDQLIDIDLGMALATKFSSSHALQAQAADALHRTINYPFTCNWIPQIKDPNDLYRCEYGTSPTNSCGAAGADYFTIAMGGAQTSRIYADPFGHYSLGLIWQASLGVSAALWTLAQYAYLFINCSGSTYSYDFAAYYACLTNSWAEPIFGIPTTWSSLKSTAIRNMSGAPQLPLVYATLFHPGGPDFTAIDYRGVLNAAPPCGPYNFSGYVESGSSVDPFVDELTSNPEQMNWSGNDWISEPDHRWASCYGVDVNPSSSTFNTDGGAQAATYNGLDYMVLFNLYSLWEGSHYLQGMINPYYADNFAVNYPDNNGFGSNSIPLKLNFLEYVELTGAYASNSNVSVRVGAQADMTAGSGGLSGFDSRSTCPTCWTDVAPKDYGCDEVPFNFASVLCSSCREAGSSTPPTNNPLDDGYYNSDTYMPIEYFPTGINFTPCPMPPENDSLNLADSLVTSEIRNRTIDSLIRVIIASGNEDAIDYVRSMGFNVDSMIQADHLESAYNLIVKIYPNPTRSTATLEYDLIGDAIVTILMTNAVGQDLTYYIEQYSHDQQAGNHKIIIDSDKLPPGFYIVNVNINGHVFSKKLSVL